MISAMELQLSSIWVALTLFTLSVALAYFSYHTPSLKTPHKYVLIALRTSALFLLSVLLLEPILAWQSDVSKKASLAIFIDQSESMQLSDFGQKRSGLLPLVLDTLNKTLGEDILLKPLGFGSKIDPLPGDSLTFNDPATNFSLIPSFLERSSQMQSYQGAVVLSDGQMNQGEIPVHAAQSLSMPIYSVLIGNDSQKQDLKISRILAPEKTYLQTPTSLNIIITHKGFENKRIQLSLYDGNTKLIQKNIILSAQEINETLTLNPTKTGTRPLRVIIDRPKQDQNPENNSKSFSIKVLDNKQHLLLVSGYPEPDLSALHNTLSTNKQFKLSRLIQKNATTLTGDTEVLSASNKPDAIILLGFPNTDTQKNLLTKLGRLINNPKTGCFYWLTRQTDLSKLSWFKKPLPFQVSAQNKPVVEDNFFALASDNLFLVPFALSLSSAHSKVLKKTPPFGLLPNILPHIKQTDMLWLAKTQTGEPQPFFWVTEQMGRKSAVISGDGLWRWRLNAKVQIRELYQETFTAALDWLARNEALDLLTISPGSGRFDAALPVSLTAYAQNQQLVPLNGAAITLDVKSKDSDFTKELVFSSRPEPGAYEANLGLLPQGRYTYKATARYNNALFATSNGSFQVEPLMLEFQNPNTNPELLKELSNASGGKFYNASQLSVLIADIKSSPRFKPQVQEKSHTKELANQFPMLILILSLLSLEWLGRKLSSLP
jgi:hypothetical protein